jgi:predicted negative regulator of RcsB-dependent stress response
MSSEKQHSPQHEELLKRQTLEQQEVKEVLVFFKKYGKTAAISLIAICVIVLANKAIKTQRLNKEAAADSALLQANTPEALQAIVDDYASTSSQPIALMGLAREKFNAGQLDEAEMLYTQFSKKHGDHELALQANLNLIACKEAKGQIEEAQALYSAFATENADSYLAPSAMMSKARCQEDLGQLDEAQITYEDIIVNFPEGTWSQLAEVNLKVVQAKK